MADEGSPQPPEVRCHSGRSYADRPQSFVWRGQRYRVVEVEREWLEPGQRHFLVSALGETGEKGEKRFQICYHVPKDSWTLREI